jgi:sarcosine oxidase subunit alpha
MFKRLPPEPAADAVTIYIGGERHVARATDSVAAAMLAAGIDHGRTTPVSGAPRAPYCMMGVCFDCLVEIDGVGNRQGCLVRVQEGMRIEMQRGKRNPEA